MICIYDAHFRWKPTCTAHTTGRVGVRHSYAELTLCVKHAHCIHTGQITRADKNDKMINVHTERTINSEAVAAFFVIFYPEVLYD